MVNDFEISDSDGKLLVKTAREVVTEYLATNKIKQLSKEFQEKFSFNAGVFVTINKMKNLRGCIGYPTSDQKLYQALADAAISAAVNDPRFIPLNQDELNSVTFEVTVLSPPQLIVVNDYRDYFEKIKIGRDGLIVKKDFHSGLLLPQVPVEYGWNVQEFLEYTCEKAGLDKNSWKDLKTKIFKFSGIIFYEESPNGVVKRKLLN